MKHLHQFITEYIIKKKLDKPIDSENYYKYYPKTTEELTDNINELIKQDIYDFNCINTSEITDMSYLFKNLYNIKIKDNDFDVSGWDISNVKDMASMFCGCKNFEGNGLENWDVSNVTNMSDMFNDCNKFDCDLSKWNVSKLKYASYMFYNCKSFKGKGLENWDANNIKNMQFMFYNCKLLKNKPAWYKE